MMYAMLCDKIDRLQSEHARVLSEHRNFLAIKARNGGLTKTEISHNNACVARLREIDAELLALRADLAERDAQH